MQTYPWRNVLAEFIGTFSLVTVGCGAIAVQEAINQHFRKQTPATQPAIPKSQVVENITSKLHPSMVATPPLNAVATPSPSVISTPPPSVVIAPPPHVVSTPPPSKASTNVIPNMGTLPKKPKSPNLGGFLNILVPGAARAYAGNWGRAIVAFIVMSTLVFIVLYLQSPVICLSAFIVEIIYMFVAGRKIIIKYNKISAADTNQ